jgi:hypothetical protein
MFLSKENKNRIKNLLEKVFNKNDSTVFHFIKTSKKESDPQYQIVFKTRKKITSEKIKTAENLLKSELDGENWELHRWNEIIGKVIPKSKVYKIPFFDTRNIEERSPWRICPIGEHWVRRHPKDLKSGKVTDHDGHCRLNPKGKDLLKSDEIKRISELEIFKSTSVKVSVNDLGFKNGNKYNDLISGWSAYWNEILKPEIPLHPNYVKALMATESSFNESPPSPTKDHKAIGLMQIMPETVGHLGPRSKDIKDHFVEISLEDTRDPSVAIAAATRWLFRKHQLVKRKKNETTWMDALEEYKGITNQKGTRPAMIRLKLNQFYNKLQEQR